MVERQISCREFITQNKRSNAYKVVLDMYSKLRL
nr:MAG TPA: hypothetical protein [Caudoviricetes sp.]DAE89675.1 MAG TPA: hypothetical protein [Bacteriophage sp.]DAT49007.1 MAG TPA: hypothetical protein [Caudoviricetes sp.]